MHEVGASKDEVGERKWEAVVSEAEVGASEPEVGASEHEVVARFQRIVRFGRVTESITLALRGRGIILVTARTSVCDADTAAGASCAIMSQLR